MILFIKGDAIIFPTALNMLKVGMLRNFLELNFYSECLFQSIFKVSSDLTIDIEKFSIHQFSTENKIFHVILLSN